MNHLYDHGTTPDGERHQSTGRAPEATGFTIHQPDDSGHDDLAALFVGGPDLDTPEGCEAAIAEVRREMEQDAA
jgi:hypothetical protein